MAYTHPREPCVYDLFEPSTGVWQYVVADSESHHCIVIDPILESHRASGSVGTLAADAILDLVRSNGYKVDRLLATHASNGKRTAIWYLLMQLLDVQGYAPQVCGGELVSQMANRFERKYGSRSGFTSTCDEQLEDGKTVRIGSLQIRAIHLPGIAPGDFGYLIGPNLFGALSICRTAQSAQNMRGSFSGTDNYLLTASLDKILSLPMHFRLLPDQGQGYDPVRTPCVTVAECMKAHRRMGSAS